MRSLSTRRKTQADLSHALGQAMEAHRQGKLDWAERLYNAILKSQPRHFDAMHFLGLVRSQQGHDAEARDILLAALKLNPTVASAWSNLGLILRKLGRPEEALASYDKALALMPDDAETLSNRGNALRELNRPREALASYDAALAVRPDYAEAHNNRGAALRDLKRLEEALVSYDRALVLRPDNPAAYNNRGVVLQDLKRFDEALASYERALTVKPGYAEALNNRGLALLDLALPKEALASFEKALDSRPGYDEALYNRGWTALLMGDFETGWKGYEHRWNRKDAQPRPLIASFPVWTGEDVGGKRIIVYEEQGLGDVIQFSRYLPILSSRGVSVTFLVCSSMHRLLQGLAPTVRLLDAPIPGEAFDFQCALASLPRAFKTTLGSVPANVPYLFPEAPLVDRWRERIGDHGFKIGICWQGNPLSKNDVERFIPLRCFAPIRALPGTRLISLQKAHGLDQLANLPASMSVETLGEDFDAGPDAFIDTAAVMCCLDLIITADTAVEHLAGALGRPVWALHKFAPDWRWLLDRTDSPWYPTMRLYRQTNRDDWDPVFSRVAKDIGNLISG